jgi:hypothetical protein
MLKRKRGTSTIKPQKRTAKANIKGKTEGNDKKIKIVIFYLYKNPKSRTL